MLVPESVIKAVRTASIPSLVLAICLFAPVFSGLDRHNYFAGRDFLPFWTAGRLAVTGLTDRIYDLEAFHRTTQDWFTPAQSFVNFSYPPPSLLVLAPLAILPYGLAYAVWQILGVVAFLAVSLAGLEAERRRALVPWILATPIVLLNVSIGQGGLFFAALIVAAVRLLDRRPLAAGVLVSLLVVKPQLGLIFPVVFMARRRWSAFWAASVSSVALVGASALLFGVDAWASYIDVTLPYQGRIVTEMDGFYTSLMVTPYAGLWWLGVPQRVALCAQLAVSVLVIGLVARFAMPFRHSPDARAVENARLVLLVSSACVLVTPYCLSYDLAIPTAGALAWRLHCRETPSRLVESALALLFAVPLIGICVASISVPLGPLAACVIFGVAVLPPSMREIGTARMKTGPDLASAA